MSIYGGSTHLTGTYDVPVAEGYEGLVGASRIIIESCANDMALFEALIGNDFTEVVLGESATDSQLEAIHEAAGVGFVDKIKAFVMKVWEKIKGLFASFMATINNVIIRDNKKFVDEYKNEVIKKAYGDNFKYNWCAKIKDLTIPGIEKIGADTAGFDKLMSDSDLDKTQSTTNSTDTLEKMYGELVGQASCTAGEFRDEFFKTYFKDSDEVEGLDQSRVQEIMAVLTESSKTTTALTKAKTSMDKVFADRLKELDKARAAVSKLAPGTKTDGKEDSKETETGDTGKRSFTGSQAAKAGKALSVMYDEVKMVQSVSTAATSSIIEFNKYYIKACRSLFAKAAAYNPKKVNEACFLEAVGQAEEHTLEHLFEGVFAY